MPKNKSTRRDKIKNAGLDKKYNLKIRLEVLDQDYLDKLSEKERDWLNRYIEEYVGANFNHKGKLVHKTKKHKKSIYDSNNARNRDSFSLCKSKNMLSYGTELNVIDREYITNSPEDALIEIIDFKNANKDEE